jgi:hypothetical protein
VKSDDWWWNIVPTVLCCTQPNQPRYIVQIKEKNYYRIFLNKKKY